MTRMAVLVPRLHTASSLRTPRTRHWLGFTATQRRPSRSGWSYGRTPL
ncbi:ribonuclease P 21 subunit (human), isoform CRA_e [Rattus norvegicus]|uniref:Ribonuclease P 21 subunit (Human), isoform CRA_e n=1 Tax=Rattus norvegicus TaxID=10116 RepID=A6KR99_RAT|nr:ribonuclease P 21 subunit (human), isoform CRA_e [Rattus norvegicus]